jgi:NodT family efflux transporter outer membrane factor (OMF) lipoprotein
MPLSNNSLLAGTAAVALLLQGCAAVGPNFARPAAPTAQGYLAPGDKPAPRLAAAGGRADQWWTAFGSPDLDRTVQQALAGSPTLTEADATLQAAREAANATRGGTLPQAQLNAGIQRERINVASFGFTGFPNPTIPLYSLGGAVAYDLDLFGGRRRAVESADAKAEAQANRASAAYLTLTSGVSLQAVKIATLRAEIAAVRETIADDQKTVDLVRRAEAAGGAPASAETAPQAQLAEDETLLPPLEQQLAEARHALAVLVGRAPSDWTAPEFELDGLALPGAVPVSLPSELVRTRPDILAAEADLHAATAEIGVQTARLYPDINLGASITQGALEPGKIFSYDFSGWNVGAGLTAPLFNGGTLKANKRAAEAEARAALARYQSTVLRAFGQVADAVQALAHDEDALAAQTRAEATAEAALRDARLAYEKGGGALLPVLDAQRQLHRARLGLAEAKGRRLADTVRLYAATAADWRTAAR